MKKTKLARKCSSKTGKIGCPLRQMTDKSHGNASEKRPFGIVTPGNEKNKFVLESPQRSPKAKRPKFDIGDTVKVYSRILEGNKERTQIFCGVVIARSGGGTREMFTVRRIVAGEGVECKFPLRSTHVAKVEVVRSAPVRHGRIYSRPARRIDKLLKLIDKSSEESLLEMVAAEDELLEKFGPTYGVGIPFPSAVAIPDSYESYTQEELRQAIEEAKQQLKLLGEQWRKRVARGR